MRFGFVAAATKEDGNAVFQQCEQDAADVIFQRHTRLIIPQSYGNDMTDWQTGTTEDRRSRLSEFAGGARQSTLKKLFKFNHILEQPLPRAKKPAKNADAVYTR